MRAFRNPAQFIQLQKRHSPQCKIHSKCWSPGTKRQRLLGFMTQWTILWSSGSGVPRLFGMRPTPCVTRSFRPRSHRTRNVTHNATQANGTYCHQWEYSHFTQATSKDLHSILCVRRRIPRPVWISPGLVCAAWDSHKSRKDEWLGKFDCSTCTMVPASV